jgi:peptidyl-prolyl cis-trans isomerase SurA
MLLPLTRIVSTENLRRLALGAVFVAGTAGAAQTQDLDRVVAVVNDDVITQTELAARLEETRKQLVAEKIALPPDPVLRRQILERLVVERIQLQQATQAGMRVSDNDIDQAIEKVTRHNNVTAEELRKRLQAQGISQDSYRAQMRDQLLIQQLQEREVSVRVNVTETEVANLLETQEKLKDVDIEFDLSHILIAIPESASSDAIQAAKKRADDIRAQVAKGGDFEQLAVANSQGPEALKGGKLGWKKAGQLPELFLGALAELRIGGVTEALRSPAGFHILRLNARRGDVRLEPVTQTHARHILLRTSEILSADDARLKLTQLRERLQNGEDFAALARAHSEDTGSAANGGDLGWANPGQMVPEFEKAMNALKPGDISTPVRSSFGIHLIQVLERRDRDVTQDRRRAAARSQIHARKAEERFQQWLRELRDQAYVEYRLDDTN